MAITTRRHDTHAHNGKANSDRSDLIRSCPGSEANLVNVSTVEADIQVSRIPKCQLVVMRCSIRRRGWVEPLIDNTCSDLMMNVDEGELGKDARGIDMQSTRCRNDSSLKPCHTQFFTAEDPAGAELKSESVRDDARSLIPVI